MPRFIKYFLSPFDLALAYSAFLFLLSLWFISKKICRLRLTEVNLTEARLTGSWTERLLRCFYRIFTLTIAVLPCIKRKRIKTFRGLWPWLPLGGSYSTPKTPSCHFTCLRAFGTSAFCFAKNRRAHIFSIFSPALIFAFCGANFFFSSFLRKHQHRFFLIEVTF